MRRRSGQDDAGAEPGDDAERARRERARRERERARKRLAEKAGGEPSAKDDEDSGSKKGKSRSGAPAAAKRSSGAESRGEKPAAASGKKPAARGEAKAKAAKPAAKGTQPKERGTGAGPKERSAGAKKPSGRDRSRSGAGGKGKPAKSGGALVALRSGVAATRKRTEGVPSRIGRGALRAAGAVFAIFFDVLGFLLHLVIGVVAFLRGPLRKALAWLARTIRAASAAVTPRRALIALVAGAAVLLALSQFADYRSVTVGTDAYAEVETVAPAPERDRDQTGSAHSYIMVPLALAVLGLLAVAVRRRRASLCNAIVAIGVIVVLVTLLVDRPAGLDPGDLEEAFDGVQAQLLGGFYAQLFAGALLAVASALLGRELRPATVREERPSRGTKGAGPPRLRRPAKPEGAGA